MVTTTVPIEIDAVNTCFQDKKTLFSAIRLACIKRGLCFKCIQLFDAETHMVNGERRCPNKNAALSEKLALLTLKDLAEVKDKVQQIAAVMFKYLVEKEDSVALAELEDGARVAVDWLLENYCSGLSQPAYP